MEIFSLGSGDTKSSNALDTLNSLDSTDEGELKGLVLAASIVCDAPFALISLPNASCQLFTARLGFEKIDDFLPLHVFFAQAMQADVLMEVVDLHLDERFADNPVVMDSREIRHYAGIPIRRSGGEWIGTLCVFGPEPRELSSMQMKALQALAEAATNAIRFRAAQESTRLETDVAPLLKGPTEAATNTASLGTSEYRKHWVINAASPPPSTDQTQPTPFPGIPPSVESVERSSTRREVPFQFWAENLPVIVSYWDRDLVCKFANMASRQWMGQTQSQVVGGHMRDLLGLEVLENDRLHIEAALAGHPQKFERSVRDRNGQMRHVLVTHVPDIRSGQVHGFLTQVTDVTELKNNQADLARMEASMREAQRMGKIGHWVWDIHNDVTEWSAEMFRMAGLAPTSRPPSHEDRAKLYTPESFARWSSLISEAQASGKAFTTEIEFYRPDGTTGWVDARAEPETNTQGDVIKLRGTVQDITERKRAQLALERSQDFLARTGALAGVGGWEVELDTLNVHWSDQVCALHGRPQGYRPSLNEALGYFTEASRKDIEAAVSRAIAGGAGFDLEAQLKGHDGVLRTVRTVGSLVLHEGRPVRLAGALQDISERHALTSELTKQHEWMRVTLQSIGDAVITTDDAGLVTWLNPVAERMTGWTQDEAKALPIDVVFRLVNELDQRTLANPVLSCLRDGLVSGPSDQAVLLSRDGSLLGVKELASPIRDEASILLGCVLVFHDQTAQRRQMKYRETHDLLTDFLNRKEFERTLDRLLHVLHHEKSPCALLYIDLDQFKLFNDACGHHAGDLMLQHAAQMLRDFARGNDIFARLGGDEFAILLERCDVAHALRIAQQVCDRLDKYRYLHQGERYRVGTSVAVVPIDSRWATVSEVMQAADRTCYAAKEAGRNRVRVWVNSDATLDLQRSNMGWATRLEHALDEDRFVLYAQRIFELQNKKGPLNVEILLRKVTRNGDLLSPAYFLQAAERFNLASRIDRWVLRHSLNFLRTIKHLEAVGYVCINLSGQSVGDTEFQETAFTLLDQAGHDLRQKICIEITETAAITNLSAATQFIARAKALGVRIALDDFGAGNASFGYLKSLAVDKLKIDGQFVRDLLGDELNQAAVRCFVDVARVLNIQTVAEFVDSEAVLDRITDMRVQYAQGFYLHRPEPIEKVFSQFCQWETGQ